MKPLTFSFLRNQIVGIDSFFDTPFGKRLMVYCDYTASGRCLKFIENYIMRLQRIYANTHTEDDITGRNMSHLLKEAEEKIKISVNAGEGGKLIACGYGSTAAIDKLQQIVGVRLPPATKALLLSIFQTDIEAGSIEELITSTQPVVFIGEYEHHSNELSWREGLAALVKVRLNDDGMLDLQHLEELLSDPRFEGRMKIGSFSAASNVTGIISSVYDIAVLLHKYGGIACFDYAASAPYVPIDMNPPSGPDEDPSLDAVFISPHKFLGGPGSVGVLVFNQRLYHTELPPSLSGGGTVDYVGKESHDYIPDIEEREKAGTPGVLQTMKAALAFMVKEGITTRKILQREHVLVERAMARWKSHPGITILGNPDPSRRIAVVSFTIADPLGRTLHPKFVTVLLNDLFGIQSRAGCSCAGPYGHYLLGIEEPLSERYRQFVRKGYAGIKPGWCRVGFHYVMDDHEAEYIIEAVEFIASSGYLFLPLYHFDLHTGMWSYRDWEQEQEPFELSSALDQADSSCSELPPDVRERLYRTYHDEAVKAANMLKEKGSVKGKELEGELGELQFFTLPDNGSQ